jgi:hypothetical protein
MQGTGPCKITGIELGEVKVEFFTPQVLPVAKYAYVDAEGRRYGSSYKNMWGTAVTEALGALKQAMEAEIAEELFGGGAGAAPLIEEPRDEEGGISSL